MLKKRPSLRLRFTLVLVATILGVAAMLGAYFDFQLRQRAHHLVSDRALALAQTLSYNSEYATFVGNLEMLQRYAAGVMRERDVEYVVIEGADGAAIVLLGVYAPQATQGSSPGAAAALPPPGRPQTSEFVDARGERLLEARAPILLRAGEELGGELFLPGAGAPGKGRPLGAVRLGLSKESTLREVRSLQKAALLLTAAISLLGVGVAILFVRRIVGPLRSLMLGTQRIAAGDLAHRVSASPGDEIGELAESFNRMTEDLGRARAQLEAYSTELEDKVRERTRKLEEARSRLFQSEKLSAIGQLVAGVAHELNNPLTGVMGYSQLLLRRATDPEVKRALEKIDSETGRCKKIVQNLLTFARKQKATIALISVNQALEKALELRSYQLRLDNVEVVTLLESELPRTMADSHQLQQAFLNIIVNAQQAMAGTKRRRLTLRTRREGERIVVEIEDNGPGIPSGLREKIFDPFFTTKEVGVGTGLGLSICYGIMQEHGGQISVESQPGEGARFILELPLVGEGVAIPSGGAAEASREGHAAPACAPAPGAPDCLAGEGLSILIVDDEPSIIDLLHRVLSQEGFFIETAANGSAALGKVLKRKYDLIITDLKMPEMGGMELHSRVRDIDPPQAGRMIFTTGDTVGEDTQAFLERTGNPWIEKPFVLDEVRARVLQFVSEVRRQRPVPV